MAKKLKKVVARLAALEKNVADFLTGKSRRKSKKAKKSKKAARKLSGKKRKAAKKTASKPVAKKAKAARKAKAPSRAKKAAAKPVPVKKAKRRAARRVLPPTVEQLAPSGAPDFVRPLDQV